MKNNLIVIATYWNEKDWIDASLAQIDALNPKKVIIVDGCFDPKIENRSTDGTREKIEAWVKERDNAELINAVRQSRTASLRYLFWTNVNWRNWPLRILMTIYYNRTNVYRLNQASTFTKALCQAGTQPGDWVTHSDSDQFYTDNVIRNIISEVNSSDSDAELLTANELTFFTDFKHYTTDYEKRNYNNLPYRMKKNTLIVPTRDVVSEKYPKPRMYGKDAAIVKKSVGTYHHYKFRPFDKERTAATYKVGDRKKPDTSDFLTKNYSGEYPSVVKSHFQNLLSQ